MPSNHKIRMVLDRPKKKQQKLSNIKLAPLDHNQRILQDDYENRPDRIVRSKSDSGGKLGQFSKLVAASQSAMQESIRKHCGAAYMRKFQAQLNFSEDEKTFLDNFRNRLRENAKVAQQGGAAITTQNLVRSCLEECLMQAKAKGFLGGHKTAARWDYEMTKKEFIQVMLLTGQLCVNEREARDLFDYLKGIRKKSRNVAVPHLATSHSKLPKKARCLEDEEDTVDSEEEKKIKKCKSAPMLAEYLKLSKTTKKEPTITMGRVCLAIDSRGPMLTIRDLRRRIILYYGSVRELFRRTKETIIGLTYHTALNFRSFDEFLRKLLDFTTDESAKAWALMDYNLGGSPSRDSLEKMSPPPQNNPLTYTLFDIMLRIGVLSPNLFLEDLRMRVYERFGNLEPLYTLIVPEDSPIIEIHFVFKVMTCIPEDICSQREARHLFALIDTFQQKGKITRHTFLQFIGLAKPDYVLENFRREVLVHFNQMRQKLGARVEEEFPNAPWDAQVVTYEIFHVIFEELQFFRNPSDIDSLWRRINYDQSTAISHHSFIDAVRVALCPILLVDEIVDMINLNLLDPPVDEREFQYVLQRGKRRSKDIISSTGNSSPPATSGTKRRKNLVNGLSTRNLLSKKNSLLTLDQSASTTDKKSIRAPRSVVRVSLREPPKAWGKESTAVTSVRQVSVDKTESTNKSISGMGDDDPSKKGNSRDSPQDDKELKPVAKRLNINHMFFHITGGLVPYITRDMMVFQMSARKYPYGNNSVQATKSLPEVFNAAADVVKLTTENCRHQLEKCKTICEAPLTRRIKEEDDASRLLRGKHSKSCGALPDFTGLSDGLGKCVRYLAQEKSVCVNDVIEYRRSNISCLSKHSSMLKEKAPKMSSCMDREQQQLSLSPEDFH